MRARELFAPRRASARVCEGTDTGSLTALRTPVVASTASARSTAPAWPAITIWPGLLKLAAATTSSPAASAQACAICASSAPSTAAIAPVPSGTASCIRRPRSRTRPAASCSDSAPAQTRAEYSPRLWPASCAGIPPPAAIQARHTPTPAASSAGWVNSVRLSCSSGPCCDSAHRSSDAPCDASSNAARISARAGEVGQHAHRLRALAGKHECKRHGTLPGPADAIGSDRDLSSAAAPSPR